MLSPSPATIIKVAVPSQQTELLGDKRVSDLSTDLSLKGNDFQGSLNHIDGWENFSSDPSENTGNFLPIYFEEAKGQPKGTVKAELKGTGAKLKKPVEVDPSDGLIVFQIHNKDNTIEVTQEGKQTKTLTVKDLTLKEV